MQREILFRGKGIDTGEWIEGSLIGNDVIVGKIVEFEWDYFCTEFWCRVDPETVCEVTGQNDKNKKRIFEGDLLKEKFEPLEDRIYSIIWRENLLQFWAVDNISSESYPLSDLDMYYCEVIGNIHDK